MGTLQEQLDAAARAAEVQQVLTEADQLSEDAGRLGIPIESITAKLTEARASVDQSAGTEALALARAAHQELVRTLLPVLEENLKTVVEDFEIARRSGVELDPMAGLLAEASQRISLPVPLGVAERIESARTQLSQTRGLVEHAERSSKRVEEAFGQAELLKLATPALRSRVEAVESQLRNRQFTRTIDLAGPLEQELLQATTQHLTRTIAGLQGLVVRARQDGVPTAAAENLLSRAKEALQHGRAMEALQLAAQSEGEIERVGLQNRVAQGALEALDAKLAQLASEGIRSPSISAMAAEARGAFDQKDFARVLEISIDAIDRIAQTRELFRRSREAVDQAAEAVDQAVAVGAEPPRSPRRCRRPEISPRPAITLRRWRGPARRPTSLVGPSNVATPGRSRTCAACSSPPGPKG